MTATASRRATSRPSPSRPAQPRPAAAASAKPKPAKGASRGGGGGAATSSLPGRRTARWLRVALLVLGVLVGLPVAHALWGEVVALLGGAMLFGFWVGRWTAD
jgi:hypothetical protein